jgi:hypothetical protein
VVDVARGDDTEPDAASERDRDEVLRVAAAAVEALEDGQRVHVVVDENGDVQRLLQPRAHVEIAPADQRRRDRPARAVDDAGHPEPDAEERRLGLGLLHPALERGRDAVESVRCRHVALLLELVDHACIEIDEHADDVVGSDLDAEGSRGASDDLQQERRPAALRRRAVGDPDEPALDQLARDRCDGRRAQAEALGDRGPRDRAARADEPQDRNAVQIAAEACRPGAIAHMSPIRLDHKFMIEQKSSENVATLGRASGPSRRSQGSRKRRSSACAFARRRTHGVCVPK